MHTVADISSEELERTLATEIANARNEARPISRLTLTKLLQSKYSLHPHEAERIVDEYCDEKAPGVPTYLSAEFGVPYLKILGVFQMVLAAAFIITPIFFPRADLAFWPAVILFLAFGTSGGYCIFRSIRPQAQKPKLVRVVDDLPQIAVQNEAAETATTGSSPSRS
jgi:hypothetical protein